MGYDRSYHNGGGTVWIGAGSARLHHIETQDDTSCQVILLPLAKLVQVSATKLRSSPHLRLERAELLPVRQLGVKHQVDSSRE